MGSSESSEQPESSNSLAPSAIEKLPDASELLNSPDFSCNALSGTDHSSRVAAAMAQSASSSRKRDSIGLASSLPRSKVPKGTLPHSKNVPDTVGGMLVPPQLSGRSVISVIGFCTFQFLCFVCKLSIYVLNVSGSHTCVVLRLLKCCHQ